MQSVYNNKVKRDILQLVEKKPEVIMSLSLDKLKELDKIYKEIIESNNRKLKRLRRMA